MDKSTLDIATLLFHHVNGLHLENGLAHCLFVLRAKHGWVNEHYMTEGGGWVGGLQTGTLCISMGHRSAG